MEPNLTKSDIRILKRLNRMSFRAERRMLWSVWGKFKVSKHDEQSYFPISTQDLRTRKLNNYTLNNFKKLGFIQVVIGSPEIDSNTDMYDYFSKNIAIIPTPQSRDYLLKIKDRKHDFIKQSVLVPISVTIITTIIIWCIIWLLGLLNIQLPNQ